MASLHMNKPRLRFKTSGNIAFRKRILLLFIILAALSFLAFESHVHASELSQWTRSSSKLVTIVHEQIAVPAKQEEAILPTEVEQAQRDASTLPGEGTSATPSTTTTSRPDDAWHAPTVRRSICTDTCATANNGVCDDGRMPKDFRGAKNITCDLGTDCSDCGAWEFHGVESALSWTPVKTILAKNITISARYSRFDPLAVPSFIMAYTDHTKDVDVSAHMHDTGMVEPHISQLWLNILSLGCVPKPLNDASAPETAKPGLVLDVGGNFGWFSLLSATMGCRVVAWEPVPLFAAFYKYGLLSNGLTHLVELRENIVADAQDKLLTITVPNRGIWGTASVGGANIDSNIANDGEYDKIERLTERVDSIIKEDVLIMKADVEGFEPSVLAGAKGLYDNYNVQNLIMEYSPGVPERKHNWEEAKTHPLMLLDLISRGYTILHLNRPPAPFTDPLPPLPLVPEEALLLDVRDAEMLLNNTLCPPAELGGMAFMYVCNSLPEALDPRSFRASFGHNTNIFAYKYPINLQPDFISVAPPDLVFPLDTDLSKVYFTSTEFGIQMRRCEELTYVAMVASRCHCTEPECEALEEAVTRLASEGKFARD